MKLKALIICYKLLFRLKYIQKFQNGCLLEVCIKESDFKIKDLTFLCNGDSIRLNRKTENVCSFPCYEVKILKEDDTGDKEHTSVSEKEESIGSVKQTSNDKEDTLVLIKVENVPNGDFDVFLLLENKSNYSVENVKIGKNNTLFLLLTNKKKKDYFIN